MKKNIFCFVILLVVVVQVSQAAAPFPVWAPHGMVSSADSLATEAGLAVLKHGGNAVDAAAAVALALGVTEGYASGIGGGCFMLIRLADGRCVAVDGREMAPAQSTRTMFVPKDTTHESTLSTEGALASGTPGELAALDLAVKNFGKLKLGDDMEGAIALADTGFFVNRRMARNLAASADMLRRFEGSRKIFFKKDSIPLQFGDRFVQSDLAKTLRLVQAQGVEAFYHGDLPLQVEGYLKAQGGILSAQDFANYKPVMRHAVQGKYRGYDILSMPPPSSGGLHVIQILNLLEPYNLDTLGAGSSAALHLIAEAMQLAFADRAEYLGDPDFVKIPLSGLLSKDYAKARRALINPDHHAHGIKAGDPGPFSTNTVKGAKDGSEKHTTHLCVADAEGNIVSMTATVNTPFGSGVVVPGLGFVLNDQMDDFVTWPGHANYFGLVGSAANEIEPGKRPLSSMSPTIVLKQGKPVMALGSMGGPRIISSVALTLINSIDFGMNLQESIDFPRIHEQWAPDALFIEPDNPRDVQTALKNRGHNLRVQNRWSVTTAVAADTSGAGWWGATDSRGQGLAKGF